MEVTEIKAIKHNRVRKKRRAGILRDIHISFLIGTDYI